LALFTRLYRDADQQNIKNKRTNLVNVITIIPLLLLLLLLLLYIAYIRKDRIRNVTIKQQIGLEEKVIKEIEQNQLTWYGHVQRMAEGRLSKIVLKWMTKQKRARGRRKKN